MEYKQSFHMLSLQPEVSVGATGDKEWGHITIIIILEILVFENLLDVSETVFC
jgi:hypothetical protein